MCASFKIAYMSYAILRLREQVPVSRVRPEVSHTQLAMYVAVQDRSELVIEWLQLTINDSRVFI